MLKPEYIRWAYIYRATETSANWNTIFITRYSIDESLVADKLAYLKEL